MSRTSSFVRPHAVPIYFGLVFLISWGGGFLALPPGSFPPSSEQFASLGPLVYLAIVAGPSVSGILMIAISDAMPGIRDFVIRLRRWRISPVWYALALIPALAISVATLLLSLVSPELRPAVIDAENRGAILMGAIGPSLVVGVFEEIGWTGFAVPRLRARHSMLVTGLVVGLVWGAWHFPLFWEADSLHAALLFTILLLRLFAWLPAFRVLLIWLHERTGSLPVVMIAHAAVSFVSIVLGQSDASGGSLLIVPLVAAATMWLLVAAVGHQRSRTLTAAPTPRPAGA